MNLLFSAGKYRFPTLDEMWTRWYKQLDAMGAITYTGERAFTDVVSDQDPLILYFLIDQSGTIAPRDFQKKIGFVNALIGKVGRTERLIIPKSSSALVTHSDKMILECGITKPSC